jgi:ABC-type phosphate transport system substrate-binding protein
MRRLLLRHARAFTIAALVCLAATFAAVPAAGQAASDIAVVVNASVPVDNLSLAELRRILLGDKEFWAPGMRVTLLIRAPIARERDVVIQHVCEMSEAQFRQHWIAKVFRAETPTGPKIVYSSDSALEQVARVPGAITFVDAALAGRGMKVLKIDGKSPGQPGYRIK